jgi:hypothetical protein
MQLSKGISPQALFPSAGAASASLIPSFTCLHALEPFAGSSPSAKGAKVSLQVV